MDYTGTAEQLVISYTHRMGIPHARCPPCETRLNIREGETDKATEIAIIENDYRPESIPKMEDEAERTMRASDASR